MYSMLREVREGTRSSGTGDADGCELPCWGWELNPGPLAEQSMLLVTEPPPQPQYL